MQSRLVALGCGVLMTLLLVGPVPGADVPTPVRLVLAQVAPMMSSKAYAKAVTVLDSALGNSETRHADLAFALGNCHMLQGNRTLAIKAYALAVALDPHHGQAWLNLAKAQYEAKAYREAGRCFAQGYGVQQPQNAETLYFSAAAYLMGGAHAEAVKSFDRLFAAHPGTIKPEWQEQYIHALIEGGQGKRALPLIRDLIAHATGELQARWQEVLLSQYVRLNMHAEGAAFARRLIDQQPGNSRWWKALAHIELAAHRSEEALGALIGYSLLKPLSDQESRLLADLYLQAGIPAKAASLYSRQLQGKGDSQVAQRLAMAYHQMDQADKALDILGRYRSLKSDPHLLMLQGEICYGLKRYLEAADSYRRAAGLTGPHQGQSWLMAGYAAMQAHDFEASRDALARALRFAREKKAATLALSQVKEQMMP